MSLMLTSSFEVLLVSCIKIPLRFKSPLKETLVNEGSGGGGGGGGRTKNVPSYCRRIAPRTKHKYV